MKKLFLFLLTPALAFAQWDEIPEPAPSEIKTEFRHSFFQANYRLQKALRFCLEQENSLINPDLDSVHFTATDLYYERSSPYRRDESFAESWQEEFFHEESKKVEAIQRKLNLSEAQLQSLIARNQLQALYTLLDGPWELTKRPREIIAASSLTKDDRDQAMYAFNFDQEGNLTAYRYGRKGRFGDTLYWSNYRYKYQEGALVEESYQKCNDLSCRKGYELETILYEGGRVKAKSFQTYSRAGNKLIREQLWIYHYDEEELDTVSFEIYYHLDSGKERYARGKDSYDDGQLIASEEFYYAPNGSPMIQRHNTTNYKYDKKGRLITKTVEERDVIAKLLLKAYQENYTYAENAFVYRYAESRRMERGEEALPLQYELRMDFY